MKVFLAGTSLHAGYGGPAYSVSRLAVALADGGVRVGLWSPDGSATSTSMLAVDAAVHRLAGVAEEALEAFGPVDILHDNGLWLPHNHRLARLARSRGIPRVVSARGMLEPWAMRHKRVKKRVAWTLYQKHDLRTASVHHATSAAEAANIERLNIGVPVCTIANGVDLPDLSDVDSLIASEAVDSTLRTAVFLGRIYPVKGLPMLIEAWRRVRPSGWRLVIAGPDQAGHLSEVKRAVAAAGLAEAVSFTGAVKGIEKRQILSRANLFVLPTYSENFGIAIAEALAHGLPVLTTFGAPWPQLGQVDCGWQVDATVEGLTEGLRAATALDSAILREMGTRGRTVVANEFEWSNVARKFIEVYQTLSNSGT